MVTTDDGHCFLSLNSSPGQIPRAPFRFTESARSSLARHRRNCDIGETLIGDEVEPCLRRCWHFSHRPVTSRKQHAKHSAVALGCPFDGGLQKSCTEALSRFHPRPRMIPPPSNLSKVRSQRRTTVSWFCSGAARYSWPVTMRSGSMRSGCAMLNKIRIISQSKRLLPSLLTTSFQTL